MIVVKQQIQKKFETVRYDVFSIGLYLENRVIITALISEFVLNNIR